MKFALILAFIPLAVALNECERELLKQCKKCDPPTVSDIDANCPIQGYDCEVEDEAALLNFELSQGKYGRDCDRLRCKDPEAVLHVGGVSYEDIACAHKTWRYGKNYALETDTAVCLKKCDTCKSDRPKKPLKTDTKAEITDASTSTPCSTAACGAGFKLYGQQTKNASPEEVDSPIACSGGGKWKDDQGVTYENVFCREEADA